MQIFWQIDKSRKWWKLCKEESTQINENLIFHVINSREIPKPTTENPSLDNLTDFYTPPKRAEPVEIERLIGLVSGFVEKISTINVTKDLQALQAIMMHNRYNIDSAMQKLMYPCTDLLQKCRFAGEIVDCRKIFQPTETTNGYCCGFNIIPDTKYVIALCLPYSVEISFSLFYTLFFFIFSGPHQRNTRPLNRWKIPCLE